MRNFETKLIQLTKIMACLTLISFLTLAWIMIVWFTFDVLSGNHLSLIKLGQ